MKTEKHNNIELGKKVINKMRRGIAKFAFLNKDGKEIQTTGTLLKAKVPTNRKVEGSRIPRDKDHIVFYDTRHGVRRQFNKHQVIAIY